jgi:rhodanese-related sulfurtransferase
VVLGLAGGVNARDQAAVAQANNAHANVTAFNVHNNTIAQLADTDENDNQRTGTPNMTMQNANLPKEKQTNLGLYLTAKQAYEKWKADPEKVMILDVRSPEEYFFVGHAPMAWKIPVAAQSYEWDAGQQQFPMKLLPDFVSRVKSVAKADDTLLVMCRSGGRSAIAVNQLAQAGFKNVYNIIDGMEGDVVNEPDSVFLGQRLKNGWKNSGAPWTYKLTPEQMRLPKQQN